MNLEIRDIGDGFKLWLESTWPAAVTFPVAMEGAWVAKGQPELRLIQEAVDAKAGWAVRLSFCEVAQTRGSSSAVRMAKVDGAGRVIEGATFDYDANELTVPPGTVVPTEHWHRAETRRDLPERCPFENARSGAGTPIMEAFTLDGVHYPAGVEVWRLYGGGVGLTVPKRDLGSLLLRARLLEAHEGQMEPLPGVGLLGKAAAGGET